MEVQARTKTLHLDPSRYHGLDRNQLIRMYRVMYCSRRLDDREIQLKRQHKIYFQISGAGHEGMQVAAGEALRAGHDWFLPYYRDRALCLSLGMTPADMLLQSVGAKDDPSSGGRQMPSHWGNPKLHIIERSSTAGMQWLQGVGVAEAALYYDSVPAALDQARRAPLGESMDHQRDEVVLVSGGEGMTSEGEFFEALNTACTRHVPVLFLVEDNGYAISVPVEVQTPGGSISKVAGGFPGLHIEECDGTDPLASYESMRRAADYCRTRKGPSLVHAHVTRPYSHSLSDDEKLYRPSSELEDEVRRDPLSKFALLLVREGILDEKEIEALEAEVDREILEATDRALAAELPSADSITRWVYSPDVDPSAARFESQAVWSGEPKTMVEMIPATLGDEMERDARVVVFGEDVADCSHEENLPQVKGKGGVFKATAGLQRRFGAASGFQFAARRSQHRGPRHRHGHARPEAGGGDSISSITSGRR